MSGSQPLMLRHLSGETAGRFPVWMMRQAGRYLPSYRAIRERHSFWEMVQNPEIAARVSLLPLEELPLDAVIFFSDILTLPLGLGIDITMKESVGPVVTSPLREVSQFERFLDFDPSRHTPFVAEALQRIRVKLPPEVTLLGFAGAPWTVASYLIEGRGKTHFEFLKSWMFRDPDSLFAALDRLGEATVRYLESQATAGAHMIQLFDTWLSEMPRSVFQSQYLPRLNGWIRRVRGARLPVIYFAKGAQHLLADLKDIEADVVSVDSAISLTDVDKILGGRHSLQGNLDPVLLMTDEPTVRKHTRRLVMEARELAKPAILNLGHGILPATPVENARAFIEEARQLWI